MWRFTGLALSVIFLSLTSAASSSDLYRPDGSETWSRFQATLERIAPSSDRRIFRPLTSNLRVTRRITPRYPSGIPMVLVLGTLEVPYSEVLIGIRPAVEFITRNQTWVEFLIPIETPMSRISLTFQHLDPEGRLKTEQFDIRLPDLALFMSEKPQTKSEPKVSPPDEKQNLDFELRLAYSRLGYSQSDLKIDFDDWFPGLKLLSSWRQDLWRFESSIQTLGGTFSKTSDSGRWIQGELMSGTHIAKTLLERAWEFTGWIGVESQAFLTSADDFGFGITTGTIFELRGSTPLPGSDRSAGLTLRRSWVPGGGLSGETRLGTWIGPDSGKKGWGLGLQWSNLSFNSEGVDVTLSRLGLHVDYRF